MQETVPPLSSGADEVSCRAGRAGSQQPSGDQQCPVGLRQARAQAIYHLPDSCNRSLHRCHPKFSSPGQRQRAVGACEARRATGKALLGRVPHPVAGVVQLLQPKLPCLVLQPHPLCQQAALAPGRPSTARKPGVRELNSRLRYARHWRQLLQLVTAHSRNFDHIHAATALFRLSEIQPAHLAPVLEHPGLSLLLGVLNERVHHLNEQGNVNVLLALGRLKQAPEPLLGTVLRASLACLPTARAQPLCNVLLALAYLQRTPAGGLLPAEARLLTLMPSATAQDISNALYACAKLRHRPSGAVMAAALARFTEEMGTAGPQAVANVLWALGELRHYPESKFMSQIVDYSIKHLQVSALSCLSSSRCSSQPDRLCHSGFADCAHQSHPAGAGGPVTRPDVRLPAGCCATGDINPRL